MSIILNGTTGITTPALDSVAKFSSADMPAGNVIQVVSAIKTDAFSSSATSPTDITGLSATITPTSASNKILVFAVLCGNNSSNGMHIRYVRNGAVLAVGDVSPQAATGLIFEAGGSTVESSSYIYLDSPSSTSALTYQGQVWTGGGTSYVNRSPNGAGSGGGVSTITLMEIAG